MVSLKSHGHQIAPPHPIQPLVSDASAQVSASVSPQCSSASRTSRACRRHSAAKPEARVSAPRFAPAGGPLPYPVAFARVARRFPSLSCVTCSGSPMVASTAVLAGTTAAALRLGGALLFYSVMPRKPRVPSIPEKPTGRAKKPEPSRADAQARPAQPNLWDFFTPDTAVGEPIEPTPPRPTTAKPARRRSRIP